MLNFGAGQQTQSTQSSQWNFLSKDAAEAIFSAAAFENGHNQDVDELDPSDRHASNDASIEISCNYEHAVKIDAATFRQDSVYAEEAIQQVNEAAVSSGEEEGKGGVASAGVRARNNSEFNTVRSRARAAARRNGWKKVEVHIVGLSSEK